MTAYSSPRATRIISRSAKARLSETRFGDRRKCDRCRGLSDADERAAPPIFRVEVRVLDHLQHPSEFHDLIKHTFDRLLKCCVLKTGPDLRVQVPSG